MRESPTSTAVDGLPDGVELAATSVRIADGLSSEEWAAALRRLAPLARGMSWWVGDLLAYGGERFGDGSYADAAKALGRTAASLRQAAYVSRQVPPEVRVEGLSWRAHRVLASLPTDEQRHWLARAADEGWTAEELQRQRDAANRERLPTGQNRDLDPADHWAAAGMPEYEPPEEPCKVVVSFESEADRDGFLVKIGAPTIHNRNGRTWSTWWPDRPKDDVKSVEFR